MADQDHIYKHSFKLKKAQKKVNTVKGELKKTKVVVADKVKKCEASDDLVVKSLIEVDVAKANMSVAL